MPVTWSDEKLIQLYCPGRGSNHDLPRTVTSNMGKVSYALTHSATAAVSMRRPITEVMCMLQVLLIKIKDSYMIAAVAD